MKGKRWTAILAAAVLMILSASMALAAGDTYYVYTENGKTLNVRSQPWVADDTLVGRLPYGGRVQVLYFDGQWACIEHSWYKNGNADNVAWVQKKYLVRNKPGSGGGSSSSSSTSKPAATTGAIGVMNREFKTLHQVDPFTIEARPVRSSGFVNLRWAPHEEAEIAGIAYSGHELQVLAISNNWYQVEEPASGKICFVMRKYTVVQ